MSFVWPSSERLVDKQNKKFNNAIINLKKYISIHSDCLPIRNARTIMRVAKM